MPRATKKPKPGPVPRQEPQPAVVNGPPGEVLTLAEAAAYLRLSESDVIGAVTVQGLPGRLVGGVWRFSRTAIQQWLNVSQPTAEMRKAAQMAVVGAWKDDPTLNELLEEIASNRRRLDKETRR